MFAPADLFVINDAVDAFLLGSFFFGLVFVGLSFVLGIADLGIGQGHDGIDGSGHSDHAGVHHDSFFSHVSIGTILAFIMWFGGISYLLRNAAGLVLIVSVLIGLVGGFVGGAAISRVMRALNAKDAFLDANEERLAGSLGRVTSSLRANGTGEITYVLNGVRQVSAARTVDGLPLPRGTEVVVLRRERGIALVEPWIVETEEDSWERRFGSEPGHQHEALPEPDR